MGIPKPICCQYLYGAVSQTLRARSRADRTRRSSVARRVPRPHPPLPATVSSAANPPSPPPIASHRRQKSRAYRSSLPVLIRRVRAPVPNLIAFLAPTDVNVFILRRLENRHAK